MSFCVSAIGSSQAPRRALNRAPVLDILGKGCSSCVVAVLSSDGWDEDMEIRFAGGISWDLKSLG